MGLTEVIQIAANLGVIAGIVVLAYELRQNHRQLSQTNEQMTAQSRFNYYQNRISEYRYTADNAEVLELILKQAQGGELSLLEKFRVQARRAA